jgi:HEPN domain-containing protein
MRPTTAEWVAKAEEDFGVLERECRARKKPAYSAIAFHAQQCAEKYLKARLCEAGREVARIHDLVILMEHVLPLSPEWELFRADLRFLTDFAVSYRYPGMAADRKKALEARRFCRAFRQAARLALGLKP